MRMPKSSKDNLIGGLCFYFGSILKTLSLESVVFKILYPNGVVRWRSCMMVMIVILHEHPSLVTSTIWVIFYFMVLPDLTLLGQFLAGWTRGFLFEPWMADNLLPLLLSSTMWTSLSYPLLEDRFHFLRLQSLCCSGLGIFFIFFSKSNK